VTNTLTMPSPGKKRASLMELRHRHIAVAESIARHAEYDRADQHDHLLRNYNGIFGGGLRPKAEEVPSDEFRKSWMISEMLDLSEARRAEMQRVRDQMARQLQRAALYYSNCTGTVAQIRRDLAENFGNWFGYDVPGAKQQFLMDSIIRRVHAVRRGEES
jgi:hypothetical protein